MGASIGPDRRMLGIGLRAMVLVGAVAIGQALLLPGAGGAQTVDPDDLVSVVIECGDGLDNDGDGHADYPADPDCVDVEDEAERTPTRLRRTRDLLRTLPIPRVPEGIEVLRAWVGGISGNGRVKVGALGVRRPNGGLDIAASVVWIGLRPHIIDEAFSQVGGPGVRYSALGVSENGRWIVGQRGNWDTGFRAYRWRDGELEELASLAEPGEWVGDMAHAVSNDGVVVGEIDLQAARWDDQGAVLLDPVDSHFSMGTVALAITPDGGMTVGSANYASPDGTGVDIASVWPGSDPSAVPVFEPALDTLASIAHDTSDDGRVIVGTSRIHFGEDPFGGGPIPGFAAFRWTQQGITWLGVPEYNPFEFPRFLFWSTSGDGAISVGWLALGHAQPMPSPVVLAGGRLRTLVDLLENEYGVDLEGWDFSSGFATYNYPSTVEISGDGRTIVGEAIPPGGTRPTAYQVHLPPACSDGLDNDGDGRVDDTEDGGCSGPGDASETRRRELPRLRLR